MHFIYGFCNDTATAALFAVLQTEMHMLYPANKSTNNTFQADNISNTNISLTDGYPTHVRDIYDQE
jgi:hypothetical protein